MLTPALGLYLALTVVLAALIVTHAVLALRVLRRLGLRRAWAALPPVTPVVAWQTGARAGAVLWGVLFVGYATLLVAAHA
jgi:hypothetical protein